EEPEQRRIALTAWFAAVAPDGLKRCHQSLAWARACSFVFKLAAAPRSTMSSPLPYYRTDQTSSDVGMIGMITASARRRCMDRRRNGTNVSEKRRRPVLVLKRCPLVPRSWTSISTLSMLLQQGETIGGAGLDFYRGVFPFPPKTEN